MCSDDEFWIAELLSNGDCDVEDNSAFQFPRHNAERDAEDPSFQIGMTFNTKGEMKSAIINHGIKNGRQIYFKKDDKQRVRASCRGENCNFFYLWP